MSTLTFEQQAARDSFVAGILSTVTFRIECYDGEIPEFYINDWEETAKQLGLSEKAISQVVEEVRQTLKLLLKFSKKRVA
jgi:hypothetical protein